MFDIIGEWVKNFFIEEMADDITKDEMEWIRRVDDAIKRDQTLQMFTSDDTGDSLFVVIDPTDKEYWLNGFETKEDAEKWITAIGLKYEFVNNL